MITIKNMQKILMKKKNRNKFRIFNNKNKGM